MLDVDRKKFATVSEEAWRLLIEEHPGVVKRLVASCRAGADLLENKGG
jgi:hypothetical protein